MKKYHFIMVSLALIVSTSSCQDEDNKDVKRQTEDQGVVIATPYLWKSSLHQQYPMSNSYIKNPIIYNQNIVIPITNGDSSRSLSLIETINGKTIWIWNDIYDEFYIDIFSHYQYQNLVTYQKGPRSYCINLDDGSTEWRIWRDRAFDPRIDSYGQYYFTIAGITNSDGYDEYIAFKGDIRTGILSEYLTAHYTYDCFDCVRAILYLTQVPNQENLLLVTYAENLPDWITQPFYGLYNTDTKEWLWDRVLVKEPSNPNFIQHSPIIVNNKVYTAIINSLVCHDITTGKQLWKRDFKGDFMFTGIIVEDGKVIGNCEDCNAYCLDAETGRQLWSVRTAGTSSRMSYLNGVVYMVGGSVPRLFAIDVATGQLLWKIDAGLLGEGYCAGFRVNAVYCLPAKDDQPAKVIALSNLYAYCFEAI